MHKRALAVFGLCAMLLAAGVLPAAAQSGDYKVARRLGGVSTRISPPITSRAGLKRLGSTPRTATALRTALAEAGLSEIADQVISTIAAADESRVREVSFPVGGRMDWMATRRAGKVTILRQVQWGGAAPFRAYEFTVDTPDRVYTFLVPRACGNLSLVNSAAKEKPAAAVAPPPPPPPPPPPLPELMAPRAHPPIS